MKYPVMAFRCNKCNRNWPHESLFQLCPTCAQVCKAASVLSDSVVSMDEARRERSYAKFEEWCELETHDARKQREEAAVTASEERVERSKADKLLFEATIKGAGFTEAEIARFEELESKLPLAHIYQYVDSDD